MQAADKAMGTMGTMEATRGGGWQAPIHHGVAGVR